MKKIWMLLIAGLVVAAPAVGIALMPPHINRTKPADKGVLVGKVVLLHGYSLKYADEKKLAVLDLTANKKVPLGTHMKCTWERRCKPPKDAPGCSQLRCTMKVTLNKVVPGHQYRLTWIRTTVTFTAAQKGKAQKGKAQKGDAKKGDAKKGDAKKRAPKK